MQVSVTDEWLSLRHTRNTAYERRFDPEFRHKRKECKACMLNISRMLKAPRALKGAKGVEGAMGAKSAKGAKGAEGAKRIKHVQASLTDMGPGLRHICK